MKARNYKGASDASWHDNPTMDFFVDYINEENEEFNDLKEHLDEFVYQGFKAEGRDISLSTPNAVGFLFVLKTSRRLVSEKTIFDALEAAIANPNISDEDVSRYAWGICRRIEGWDAR